MGKAPVPAAGPRGPRPKIPERVKGRLLPDHTVLGRVPQRHRGDPPLTISEPNGPRAPRGGSGGGLDIRRVPIREFPRSSGAPPTGVGPGKPTWRQKTLTSAIRRPLPERQRVAQCLRDSRRPVPVLSGPHRWR